MPKLTKLSIATTALILAAAPAVFAQDAEPIMEAPKVVDLFTAADVDADGALDRDEFTSYVIMRSDSGDADYSAVKISGDYDNHFNMKDYNADGLLTADELKALVAEPEESEESSSELEPG